MVHVKKNTGFTVLELMVVTLIIIILIAVAVPAYQGYQVKSKLSEAYTLIDVIAKSEISYFNTNQEFYHIFEPTPVNLSDTMTLAANPKWAKLGYPTPLGSRVYFNYDVEAGKTDNSGSELYMPVNSISGNGFAVSINPTFMTALQFDGTTTTQCNVGMASADTMGISLLPSLDWTVIRAVGDLNHEQTTSCTTIARVIQASPATQRKATSSVQFVTFNLGK